MRRLVIVVTLLLCGCAVHPSTSASSGNAPTSARPVLICVGSGAFVNCRRASAEQTAATLRRVSQPLPGTRIKHR